MENTWIKNAKILIVDDEEANVSLLERILERAGYTNLQSTQDARQVLPLYLTWQPDLLLLDLHMPHLDGFAVLQQLQPRIPSGSYLPILVLTADVSSAAKRKALIAGAKDFLAKPLDTSEVLLRIHNLLQTRFQNQILETEVQKRTRALAEAQRETLNRLAITAEYRDDDTGTHTKRVGAMSSRLAELLGWPAPQVELMRSAAPLHDVGKIGIPDAVLLKPGKLTDDEFTLMKTHTVIGAQILAGSASPYLQLAEEIALTHHERWDGGGYTRLKAEQIPLSGRIVAVTDVFDALTHERPYKQAWPVEDAVAEITRQSGQQFDPHVVQAFFKMQNENTSAPVPEEPWPEEL